MQGRIFQFFALQAVGASLGALLVETPYLGALSALVLVSALWAIVDWRRSYVLMRWLRSGTDSPAPVLGGGWGDLAQRVSRLMQQQRTLTEESKQRLQEFLAAIQASPNGVLLLDSQQRIEWFNQTAAAHLGLDPQRDVMQNVGHLLRDPVLTAYLADTQSAREMTLSSPNSLASRPQRLAVQVHRYGQGRSLMLSRDITALEQAETMRRDFVANVSHEIRTPLSVLGGFVETLQTLSLTDAERKEILSSMATQARRMQALVVDLLALSKLEGSPAPAANRWVAVQGVWQQCKQDAMHLAKALGTAPRVIDFSFDGDVEIAGDASELQSAFANLISNALRYTPADQPVRVQWQLLPDASAQFSVQDAGPGISQEHLPRLTERFYRVDHSRSRETGGTGLGLAIVKHVAQRHAAQLRIESKLGVGSTFSMVFPAQRVRNREAL